MSFFLLSFKGSNLGRLLGDLHVITIDSIFFQIGASNCRNQRRAHIHIHHIHIDIYIETMLISSTMVMNIPSTRHAENATREIESIIYSRYGVVSVYLTVRT